MSRISNAEWDALDWALRLRDECHVSTLPGKSLRRATLAKLARRGFMTEETLIVCDGDGRALEPQRVRSGFTLTTAGIDAAKAIRALERALSDGRDEKRAADTHAAREAGTGFCEQETSP